MIEIDLKGTKLKLYSNSKELPITKYNEMMKLSTIDIGVGSELKDFNNHFTNLHAYLKERKVEEAIQETINLHNNFFYMVNEIGIWSFSFAVFIHSIDGKKFEDSSLEAYNEMMKKLSKKGLTVGQCEEVINDVKKKLSQNFNTAFLAGSIPTPMPTQRLI